LYINYAIGGLVEFPAVFLSLLALRILGRRIPQSASFILGGFVLLLNLAFPNGIVLLILNLLRLDCCKQNFDLSPIHHSKFNEAF
jgi:hypothetical protein